MDKFNIVIIRKNDFQFDISKFDSGSNYNIDRQLLKNSIGPYIEIVETDCKTMMEVVVNTIKLEGKLLGDTTVCHQDDKYIYQICHFNPEKNNMEINNEDMNGLSSHLVMDHNMVYGSTVLIKSKISENFTCVPQSVKDIDEIVDLLCMRVLHKGIMIKTNGTVENIQFYDNPLEKLTKEECSEYRWLELPFLKFAFIIFIKLNPEPDEINKKATRLVGNYRVKGDVLVISKSTENDYLDIDRSLFKVIDKLTWGKLSKRKLIEEETEDKKINSLPIVMNRYCILMERYKKIQTNSYNFICTGCYRMKYKDKKDQEYDWSDHKNECLYNKRFINEHLKINEIKKNQKKESENKENIK